LAAVGWLMVAGFVAFMTGAAGWRVAYEQPMERSLPVMHADRGRLRWIHGWMIPGVVLTTSGLAGLAWAVSTPTVAAAAAAYALGAVLWIMALVLRLTVGEWAAEQMVESGSIPEAYPPLARWAGLGHAIHMLLAYATAVPLGWSLSGVGLVPDWLAWAGTIWGSALFVLFLVPRTRSVAAPPFWAHVFTFAVAIALLA
jgi:hypothetical protein